MIQIIKQVKVDSKGDNKTALPEAKSDNFMDSTEICAYLKISMSQLYRLTSSNSIPHYKPTKGVRGKLYFEKNEIDNWILSGKVEAIDKINAKVDVSDFNEGKRERWD